LGGRVLVFEYFYGSSLPAHVLFYCACGIVVADFFATLFTIFYQNYWYTGKMRPAYKQDYYPKCSVIVPCKGIPKDLGKNLEGFLELDYSDYEVVFVTESQEDAAVSVIQSIIAKNPKAKLAIAGLAKSCAQKNFNLLEAVRQSSKPDVYVFADSDIRPAKHWLRELILPLANQKIGATSGFRWLHANKGTIGELTHSYVNIFMYVAFSVACFFGGVGLWGGSMAIRRKDFEDFGVADRWAKAAVDDMCLSQIVLKSSKKAVVVPLCITHTDDLLPTVGSTIKWFERQIMYLKAYQKALWLFATLPLVVVATILLLLLPTALILSLTTDYTFTELGGGASLLFYIGEILTALLYPLLGKMPRFSKFLFLWPFLRITHVISYYRTLFTNKIIWAGIKYQISFNGDVADIERLAK
jgi:glycosyltransferase involved in cell wall biosynthesis